MFIFLPIVYYLPVVVVECLAGVTGCGQAPRTGETSSVRFLVWPPLSPTLWCSPLQVLSKTVLDTLSPIPVVIFFISVALHPVLPALPHLGAGAGDGASQGGIRVAWMSRHVGCERVMLGVYQF